MQAVQLGDYASCVGGGALDSIAVLVKCREHRLANLEDSDQSSGDGERVHVCCMDTYGIEKITLLQFLVEPIGVSALGNHAGRFVLQLGSA